MKTSRTLLRVSFVPLIVSAAVSLACGSRPERTTGSTAPVRLVDHLLEAAVSGTPDSEENRYRPTVWRFEDSDSLSFHAVQGVEELRVEDGILKGRTTSSQPILVAERGGDVPVDEPLYAVEVRGRVEKGTRMSVWFDDGPTLVLRRAMGSEFGILTTPIPAGDEIRTYVMRTTSTRPAGTLDRILLIPTDVSGAEFEIESVRILFRGERLKSIPAGVGWHGMSNIYRESIVSRSPEVVRFDVTLPEKPRLELAVATSEDTPVTFRVDVKPSSGAAQTLTETVSEPETWHDTALDLDKLAGEQVELTLSLASEAPGALGFWGAPVVRSSLDDDTSREAPRGVVLVIIDTLRSDHLQFHGYARETAPNLARLGEEGVIISDTISQSTFTKVSVPSILTSLYPTTHTVAMSADRLPASAQTIAESFREAGFATMGVASIPFVGQFTNMHQGFELYHEYSSLKMRFEVAPEVTERAGDWIAEHADVPFFAMLHISDPHSPFRPLKEFETAFAEPGDMDRLDELVEQVRPHIAPGIERFFGQPNREDLQEAGIDEEEYLRLETAGYDGSILGVDDAVGRLIERLTALDLEDDIVVAVVSDHGTEFLEHGRHFHGHSTYGDLNRVPMVFWGPGFLPARGMVESTAQTLDLMPTLLELARLPVPDGAQGRSLVPLFAADGPGLPRRPAVTETIDTATGTRMTSIIDSGWHLARIAPPDAEPRFELYDHVEDPLSLHDVAADNPEVVAELTERMAAWRKFAEAAKLDDARALESMDSEELERLRSLGYVQ
jgi:arylsulfatase A-like enzyme